jgi:hypothetical protein
MNASTVPIGSGFPSQATAELPFAKRRERGEPTWNLLCAASRAFGVVIGNGNSSPRTDISESARCPRQEGRECALGTRSLTMTPHPTRSRPMGAAPTAATRAIRRRRRRITFSRRTRSGEREQGHHCPARKFRLWPASKAARFVMYIPNEWAGQDKTGHWVLSILVPPHK